MNIDEYNLAKMYKDSIEKRGFFIQENNCKTIKVIINLNHEKWGNLYGLNDISCPIFRTIEECIAWIDCFEEMAHFLEKYQESIRKNCYE